MKALDTYRELNYGLSKIEVQKLAYFLQEAGEPLKLPFVKHHYGPYSDTLRHALNTMEGHFIRGLGDGVSADPNLLFFSRFESASSSSSVFFWFDVLDASSSGLRSVFFRLRLLA